MKKLVLFFIILVNAAQLTYAQNPSYRQKLYYTCKIWGFVKYYHSEVSTCQVNWDSVLVSHLPAIKIAVTNTDFNNELLAMVNAAGPMAIATSPLPDTIQPELKYNRNFSWINDTVIRNDVRVLLDTIRNNFRPHPNCWVQISTTGTTGWLLFPYDSLMLNVNTTSTYPNESNRLLMIFKYWNITNYFNPYNYVLDQSPDSTLSKNILYVTNASNATNLYYAVRRFSKELDDAHSEGLTASQYISPPTYYYSPQIVLRYANRQYIVVKTSIGGLARGDVITSVNGQSTTALENNLRPYVSAGDSSVFHRFMCAYILNGYANSGSVIGYIDSLGISHTVNASRTDYIGSGYFTSYYPNDTLATVKYRKFGCNVGYVNMGELTTTDVTPMYNLLRNCTSIIFDVRNYPQGTIWALAAKMLTSGQHPFARFTEPDVEYPGTYHWTTTYLGSSFNSIPYTGQVIILMNEQTQSHAEYTCMGLETLPNVVKVGSQTAGADGNISLFRLSQDLYGGFTTLGTFYPNGDSTQRIGIRPDTLVYPTPEGIRHHRDEVLEKALQIANCAVGIAEPGSTQTIDLFPNPAGNELTIRTAVTEPQQVRIFDISGKLVLTVSIHGNTAIDVRSLQEGLYNVNIQAGKQTFNRKLAVIH